MLGGRTRARTWDPLIKSQLLYQLSYAPERPVKALRGRSFSKAIRVWQATGRKFSKVLPQRRKSEKPLDSSGFARVDPKG